MQDSTHTAHVKRICEWLACGGHMYACKYCVLLSMSADALDMLLHAIAIGASCERWLA